MSETDYWHIFALITNIAMQSSTKDNFSYAQMEALHADQRIGQVWQNMLDSLDSVKGFIQPNHSPHLAVLVQFYSRRSYRPRTTALRLQLGVNTRQQEDIWNDAKKKLRLG